MLTSTFNALVKKPKEEITCIRIDAFDTLKLEKVNFST